MKSGTKVTGLSAVIYIKRDESLAQSRFGFVVSKMVGGAVQRNLVKRRLRSIARQIIRDNQGHFDCVVRALPAASTLSWAELEADVTKSLGKALRK